MLEKIKGLGAQMATKANDAVDDIASSVKGGAEAINDKAVRASTAQMCNILEIAIEELKTRPLSAHPVSLTTTVNIGIAALEMQIHLRPDEMKNDAEKAPLPQAGEGLG